MIRFRSPATGRLLRPDGPHALSDGNGELWPVVDGIPYLRIGSDALAASALRRLDAGDRRGALLLLLAENDRWWTEPPPGAEQLGRLIDTAEELSLREAMDLLGWGRVGDYFAYRWTDPTFVAGLALMDAHWPDPASAFELACGIGHYLRALDLAGVEAIGADVVFAKLWVARHWVAPNAQLLCFDADRPWPVALGTDLAFCHDAFYFLGDKAHAAGELVRTAPALMLAHIHNAAAPNLSSGAAMSEAEVRALFAHATLYADEELTAAAVEGRLPEPGATKVTEAFAVVTGAPRRTEPCSFGLPAAGQNLRRNPLCRNGEAHWPSRRYAEEYGARATFACSPDLPDRTVMAPQWTAAVRRRELVDLPERW